MDLMHLPRKPNRRFSLAVALVGLLLNSPTLRAAHYIVPPGAATVDAGANSGAGDLVHPVRIQTVYGSSLFANGPMLIQQLRYCPSAFYGQVFLPDRGPALRAG